MIKDRKTLQNGGTDNDFLNTTPMAQEIKTGIEKWGLQHIKHLTKAKETIKSGQTDCRLRGKLTSCSSIRELIYKIHEELKNSGSKNK